MSADDVAIATVIKRQIGPMALMSCGAHEFAAIHRGLRFKVGGRLRWTEVVLDPSDTYTVTVFRLDRQHRRVVEYTASDVSNDQLAAVIRRHADRGPAGASRTRRDAANPYRIEDLHRAGAAAGAYWQRIHRNGRTPTARELAHHRELVARRAIISRTLATQRVGGTMGTFRHRPAGHAGVVHRHAHGR